MRSERSERSVISVDTLALGKVLVEDDSTTRQEFLVDLPS